MWKKDAYFIIRFVISICLCFITSFYICGCSVINFASDNRKSSDTAFTLSGKSAAITDESDNGVTSTVDLTVPEPIKIESISINISSTTLQKGESIQAAVVISPDNAENKNITWKSDDISVIKIDSNGKISAVGSGTATITAKADNGVTQTVTLTVNAPVQIKTISISVPRTTLQKGESIQAAAVISPDNAENKNITWSSSDTSVASIDKSGKITAINAGNATITAKSDNGVTSYIKLQVSAPIEAKTVSINVPKTALAIGESIQATIKISPDNAVDNNIFWNSNDTSVATIDKNGIIKAINAGTSVITAKTSNGVEATISIIVRASCQRMDLFVTYSRTNTDVNIGREWEYLISATVNNEDIFHYYNYENKAFASNTTPKKRDFALRR